MGEVFFFSLLSDIGMNSDVDIGMNSDVDIGLPPISE
jgi:hypothetical protein